MNDEKKYLISCWGTIILFILLIVTISLSGAIGGIGIFTMLLMIISCGSTCYFGNRPGPMIETQNQEY
jgi:hypothetical protein